jgi:hypothetical protein
MIMQVFALVASLDGYDDSDVDPDILGLFTTRELAEAQIVKLVLAGRIIRYARIDQYSVISPESQAKQDEDIANIQMLLHPIKY